MPLRVLPSLNLRLHLRRTSEQGLHATSPETKDPLNLVFHNRKNQSRKKKVKNKDIKGSSQCKIKLSQKLRMGKNGNKKNGISGV